MSKYLCYICIYNLFSGDIGQARTVMGKRSNSLQEAKANVSLFKCGVPSEISNPIAGKSTHHDNQS